jgi:hypothetical protein
MSLFKKCHLVFLTLLFVPSILLATVFTITRSPSSLILTAGDSSSVTYTVSNNSSNHSTILGPFAINYFPNQPADSHISISTDGASTCTAANSLAYGASCTFVLNITGVSATSSDILLPPSVCGYHGAGPCEIPTADNVLNISVNPTPISGRNFTIKNMCPFRVSFGFVSGSVQAPLIPASGGTSCSKDNPCASPLVCAYANTTATTGICSPMKDIFCNPTYYNAHTTECNATMGTEKCGACPNGSSCNVSAGNVVGGVHTGLCFNSAPEVTSPASGSHILAAGSESSPSIAVAHLTPSLATVDVKWSGGVFPRLIAQSGSNTSIAGWCRSDKDADKACDLGQGPQPPFTGAEFTLLHASQDTYDVTLIDGPTIPVSMAPTSLTQDSANAYLCGAAGGTSAQSGSSISLPASTWTFSSPGSAVGYNFVYLTSASESCTSNSDCSASSAGTTCGMGYDPTTGDISGPKCGTLLGHWTGGKACSFNNPTFNTLFGCSSPSSYTTQLYQCIGQAATSCYSASATTSCCGCTNWTNTTPSKTCVSANPNWQNDLLTHISWLKDGSPTSYSYPYDDASSTFTCPASGTSTDIGSVDYTVTFCPGGNTGGITPPAS